MAEINDESYGRSRSRVPPCLSNDEVEFLEKKQYKNIKEVSHSFCKKIQNSENIGLSYNHRDVIDILSNLRCVVRSTARN